MGINHHRLSHFSVPADPAPWVAAAAMGAVAFQKGLGGMHALAHPIGAVFDTHHGMTNAVLMPYVLTANRAAIDETITRLTAYLDVPGGTDGFIDHVVSLRDDLGVPHRLADLGVDVGRVSEIAAAATVDPSAGGNHIPFNEALAAEVFVNACTGTLEGSR